MLPTTPSDVGDGIFPETPLETVYVVSEEAKALYQKMVPWKDYDIVVMQTGVDGLHVEGNIPRISGYYDLNGKRVIDKQRGLVIVRYSDGSTFSLCAMRELQVFFLIFAPNNQRLRFLFQAEYEHAFIRAQGYKR